MAVDFTLNEVISVLAGTFFGSTTLAGLAIMLAVFVVFVVILASVKAPVTYAMVPMMILALFFSYLGIVDTTISFVIIILSVVLVAKTASDVVSR